MLLPLAGKQSDCLRLEQPRSHHTHLKALALSLLMAKIFSKSCFLPSSYLMQSTRKGGT